MTVRGELHADDVIVRCAGEVDEVDRDYARQKVSRVGAVASRPVRYAKVALRLEADPARTQPASAAAELDVDGRVARATGRAATMREAIDLAEARLRTVVERLAHRVPSERRRHRDTTSWHHGDGARP
jgi:ribosome-associated translation inhibitor RaiA